MGRTSTRMLTEINFLATYANFFSPSFHVYSMLTAVNICVNAKQMHLENRVRNEVTDINGNVADAQIEPEVSHSSGKDVNQDVDRN